MNYQVYLSQGQETVSSALAEVLTGHMIFAQHRAHDTYLAFGGPPERLRDELMGLPTGTSGGRAGSNCIQCHTDQLTMFGHHGLIGENVPQGVGAALGSGRPVICFFGDGSAEEDYVLTSIGFAATHRLPVLFVCHDNDLSILTPIETRRKWRITDVANSMGIPALDITDDPWTIMHHAREQAGHLPALLNIYVCRKNWHVGIGNDGPPEWDRLAITRDQMFALGLAEPAAAVELELRQRMEELWRR